jgi:hypothetical protein
MAVETDKVEAILRQHWKIPADLSAAALRDMAFRIQVMVGQKYSHDNLKYQLHLMQTKGLRQQPDEPSCDQIASALLGSSRA